jgi:hypothetical protein
MHYPMGGSQVVSPTLNVTHSRRASTQAQIFCEVLANYFVNFLDWLSGSASGYLKANVLFDSFRLGE